MKVRHETSSKYLALILRHKPEAAGIVLDSHGWANVEELINSVEFKKRSITKQILEEIVDDDQKYSKGRYRFNETKTKICANQGHSITEVTPELKRIAPPEKLYHGTSQRVLELIKDSGIKKMDRNFVHLSADYSTAVAVGKRHGSPLVLTVEAGKMSKDGIEFYQSLNGVWLVDYVPVKYIKFE